MQYIINYLEARGYLKPDERQLLYDLAKEAATIINVGTEFGSSLHCIRQGNPRANIIAVDLDNSKIENIADLQPYVHLSESLLVPYSIKYFLQNMFMPTILLVTGNSNTIPLMVKAELIFVDGCHWGECFQNDIEKYSRLCTKYLLFHDYSDSPIHAGVKETLDNWECNEFKKTEQVDTIAIYQRVK